MLFPGERLPSSLLVHRKTRFNFNQQKLWDPELEKITGIRMVEPSLASEPFGQPSLYLKTPLSGHFFYDRIANMPRCTASEWSSIWDKNMNGNAIKSNMDYIHTTVQGLNFSVYDTCRSHEFFSFVASGTSNVAWFGNATTCEDMKDTVLRALKM